MAQGHPFVRIGHPEVIHMVLRQGLSHGHGAQSIGIGLDHGHHALAVQAAAVMPQIGRQGLQIQADVRIVVLAAQVGQNALQTRLSGAF